MSLIDLCVSLLSLSIWANKRDDNHELLGIFLVFFFSFLSFLLEGVTLGGEWFCWGKNEDAVARIRGKGPARPEPELL